MQPRDEIFYCTTPVTVTTEQGTVSGTGFFFHFCTRYFSLPAPALVTNKHVLHGARRVAFPLNLAVIDDRERFDAEFQTFEAAIDECVVIDHPNGDIDLCAILLGPFIDAAKARTGRETALFCADPKVLASAEEFDALRPLDSVVMIGYPRGLWDNCNNQPICRRGVLATRPALDFQGRPEFLIDLACFPGSSGSPVYLYDVGSYMGPDGIVLGQGRTRLLGVLYAGPMYDAKGHLHPVPVPTSGIPFSAEVPMHLGFVIKAQEVLKLDEPIKEFVQSLGYPVAPGDGASCVG